MAEYGQYRIELDREWSLTDLAQYPRTFEQVYFFFLSVDKDISITDQERIEHAYNNFPWQGGYSTVNFFNQLRFATSREGRPEIIGIEKHSPGYLDLGLYVGVATTLAAVVKALASAINVANTTYNNVYNGAQERKLLRLKVEQEKFRFTKEQIDFITKSNKQLSKLLGIEDAKELNRLTNSPYITLKILLSIYRRVRTLCEFENKGKAHLTENELLVLPRIPRKRTTRRKQQ